LCDIITKCNLGVGYNIIIHKRRKLVYLKKLLLLLMILTTFSGCTGTGIDTKVEYKKISAGEAKTIIDKESNIIILDVRTQDEFDAGHIKNAVLLPDNEVTNRAASVLPNKSKKILVYCWSGRRSALASQALIQNGV